MPLGIYVQVPFCQTKCTYCNFHTGPASRSLYAPYARAVEREIREHRAFYAAAGVGQMPDARGATSPDRGGPPHAAADTIYIGGGTPSLLDPADLAIILRAVREAFVFAPTPEVTLEADPETIDAPNAAAWRVAGVNRISMGAQSFADAELIAAGRKHRREDIFRAIQYLRAAGYDNFSLDLIAGLPRQTEASWRGSLEEIVALRPEHVSIYLLEVDDASRLGKEVLAGGGRYSVREIPGDDDMAAFYELAVARLAAAGYEHYEISNWALPSRRSRHNLKYWRREPYFGFGAGAHSFDGRWRWSNAHDARAYVAALEAGRLPIDEREKVTPAQALDEEMFLGLRQLEGIDVAQIEKQYGVELNRRIAPLEAQGLVVREGPRVRLAPERLTVSNEAFVALLHA